MGQVRDNRRIVGMAAAVIVAATSVATASSASASAVSACAGSSLVVSHTSGAGGAGGHGGLLLRFRNKSAASCRIHGYPGFDALGPRGGVLGRAVRTEQGYLSGSMRGVPSVTLRPGHYASAGVEWLNANASGGDCVRSTTIAYTPAGTKKTVKRTASVARCSLEVHPTVPGKSGRLS